jgi:hypothetical protein
VTVNELIAQLEQLRAEHPWRGESQVWVDKVPPLRPRDHVMIPNHSRPLDGLAELTGSDVVLTIRRDVS